MCTAFNWEHQDLINGFLYIPKRLSIDKTYIAGVFSLSILCLNLKKRIHATFWEKPIYYVRVNGKPNMFSWLRIYSKRVTVRKYLATKSTLVTNHVTILSPLCIRVVLDIKDIVQSIPYQWDNTSLYMNYDGTQRVLSSFRTYGVKCLCNVWHVDNKWQFDVFCKKKNVFFLLSVS